MVIALAPSHAAARTAIRLTPATIPIIVVVRFTRLRVLVDRFGWLRTLGLRPEVSLSWARVMVESFSFRVTF
jgi:hypothetical protein